MFFDVRIPPRRAFSDTSCFSMYGHKSRDCAEIMAAPFLVFSVESTLRRLVGLQPWAVHPTQPTNQRIVGSTKPTKNTKNCFSIATMRKKCFPTDCKSKFHVPPPNNSSSPFSLSCMRLISEKIHWYQEFQRLPISIGDLQSQSIKKHLPSSRNTTILRLLKIKISFSFQIQVKLVQISDYD